MFHNTFQSGVISILSASGSHPLQLWDISLDQASYGRVCRIKSISLEEDGTTKQYQTGENKEVVGGPAIEINGNKLSQNYIICPPLVSATTPQRPSLGITLPYLYLTLYVPSQSDFTFEVTILDSKQMIRRFRGCTYQFTTNIKSDICTFPVKLERAHKRVKRDPLLIEDMSSKKKQKSVHDVSSGRSSSYERTDDNTNSYYGPSGNSDNSSDEEADDDDCNKSSCWNRICIPLSEYTKLAYGTEYIETMWVQIHANCRLKRVYFAEKEMNEDDELPEEFRLYHRPQI